MRHTVRALIRKSLLLIDRMLGTSFLTELRDRSRLSDSPSSAVSKAMQMSLRFQYQNLMTQRLPLPKLTDVGFRAYSQTDEDGIILFISSLIGTTNKIFVEVGAGDGMECNCANLAVNFGWHGLFVDADETNVAYGERFYRRYPDTRFFPPKFMRILVDRENVNGEIVRAGFSGDIDFLSVDVDGMDYWIWEAIDCINPRVVAIEANGKFGTRSITIPYDPNWIYDPDQHPHYHGASLPALDALAKRKGYRLVGTNRFGYNAFFVRDGIAEDLLPYAPVEFCRTHPTRRMDESLFEGIKHLPYVEI